MKRITIPPNIPQEQSQNKSKPFEKKKQCIKSLLINQND